jgi:hypothetical protein
VKKLEQRMSKRADSPPLALAQQVDRTKARFDKYSRSDYYVERMDLFNS